MASEQHCCEASCPFAGLAVKAALSEGLHLLRDAVPLHAHLLRGWCSSIAWHISLFLSLCLQAGCLGVQRLVRSCPASDLEAYDEQLLTGLLGVLSHQHSRVRLTALTALNALVLKVTPP